jgi:hypothetical protein
MIRRLVFLLTVVLVAAACGAETAEVPSPTETTRLDPTSPTAAPPTTVGFESPQELFDAAVGDMQAQSARFEGALMVSGAQGIPAGDTLNMRFSGAFDNANRAFSFTMDLTPFAEMAPAGEIPPEFAEMFSEIEMRQIGDVAYMRFPFFAAFLGVETEWIMMPADESNAAAGSFTNTPSNPADMLKPFQDAEMEIEEVGIDTVRGIETTRYRIHVDTESLLASMTPSEQMQFEQDMGAIPVETFPIDIWIDGQGLVRRFILAIDGSQVQHQPGDEFDYMAMSFEMYDVGSNIVVESPPADQVTDLSTELAGLFGLES